MRVLAHIHTLNDVDIIDRPIEAILRQTHPVDGILIVDNGSTDGTLERESVKNATVLHHQQNRGTSGAVVSGLQFALDHDYDWLWVFDADSVPEPDALEKLLDRYAGWPQSLKDETAFIACTHYNVQDGLEQHGGVFTKRGFGRANPGPQERYYPCHVVIWSGCLYRLAAIRRIGLPNPDYMLDWGDGEYGYHVMKAGYKGFIDRDAILHHNIRGFTSISFNKVKLGPVAVTVSELAPIRCYYAVRNALYFALYDAKDRRFGLLCTQGLGSLLMTLKFLLRPHGHGGQIRACLRGIWDGVSGNIAARY